MTWVYHPDGKVKARADDGVPAGRQVVLVDNSDFNNTSNVPQGGNYEVFVRYPQVAGAAADAKFTVTHEAGSTDRTVDQTANSGTWVSLGTYAFVEGRT